MLLEVEGQFVQDRETAFSQSGETYIINDNVVLTEVYKHSNLLSSSVGLGLNQYVLLLFGIVQFFLIDQFKTENESIYFAVGARHGVIKRVQAESEHWRSWR